MEYRDITHRPDRERYGLLTALDETQQLLWEQYRHLDQIATRHTACTIAATHRPAGDNCGAIRTQVGLRNRNALVRCGP